MAFSVNTPVSDGITKQYAVTFTNGIFNRNNVKVFVQDDVDGGGNQLERSFTWINDGLIELDEVAPAGKVVTIRRIMDKTAPAVDFVDGAILDEQNLDEQSDHLLNTMHEVLDGYGAESIQTDIDMNGHRITNFFTDLSDPSSIASIGDFNTFVGQAEDAANASSTSASQSASSAASSASSASAANTSAVNAGLSAVAAKDALTEFNGKYYGSLTSDPTLDPNGDPVGEGDTYWNSTVPELRVYNGVTWVATTSTISTIKSELSFTSVAGQLTFAINYDVGYLEVYYNGVRLTPDVDFTADTGVTFTLAEEVVSDSDVVTAVAFGAFDVLSPTEARGLLDVYSKAESDTGRKNFLINGNLNTTIVNQRGFAGGQPAAGVYGYDRWKGDTLGTRIEQVVENTEVINETFTISWVGGTGTADVDGVTGLNSGDSFTLNTSTNFSVIIPTDATYVQLEKGSVATPFEYRPIGEELALCQRYYEFGSGNAQIFSGDVTNGGAYNSIGFFAVPKRTIPSMQITNFGTLGFPSTPSIVTPQINGFRLTRTANTTAAARFFQDSWTADAEL